MTTEAKQILDQAYEELARELPDSVLRVVDWVREPGRWWLRVPGGILCLIGGGLAFLPILGLELIPIGLLLLAEDFEFLQRPVARAMLWGLHRYREMRERRPREAVSH